MVALFRSFFRSTYAVALALAAEPPASLDDACLEYFRVVSEAHDRLVVRDQQRERVADITDPFEVAAAVALPWAPEFRREFEALLGRITPENLELEAEAFVTRWKVPRRRLLVMLLPYSLYQSRYPGLGRALPDRLANQRALARVKRDEFRAEHPRLEARYRYYAENIGRRSAPEMARELDVPEWRVYRELSALFLQIASSLGAATEGIRERYRRGEALATIAEGHAISEMRLSFFLHFDGLERRSIAWDRWVQDEGGVRMTEERLLRLLSGREDLTVAEMAEALNAARGRELGRPVGPEDVAEFRTYASTEARRRNLGLAESRERTGHDVYRLGYGAVVANGRLRAPEALEYLRDRRRDGHGYAEIAHDLGVGETTLREFERKFSEEAASGLPTVLSHLLGNGGGPSGTSDGGSVPPDGGGKSDSIARKVEEIARFALANRDHELGAKPRIRASSFREGEQRLGKFLSEMRRPGQQPLALEALRKTEVFRSGSESVRQLLEKLFTDKLFTLQQNVEAIARFALANQSHALGAKPRTHVKNLRDGELHLGRALQAAKNPKNHARSLELLRKSATYQGASETERSMLEEMFSERRGTFEGNIASIVRFALENREHPLGPRPRRNGSREREKTLAGVLAQARSRTDREKTLQTLRTMPEFREASPEVQAMLESMFEARLRKTLVENIEALVRFAIANKNHEFGARPRVGAAKPREGEEAIAQMLSRYAHPNVRQRAIQALRDTKSFQEASPADRAMLEGLFDKTRATLEENIEAIARFVLANQGHLSGAKPRTGGPNLREGEAALGRKLSKLKIPRCRKRTLESLRKTRSYREAPEAGQRLLEAVFGETATFEDGSSRSPGLP